MCAYVCVWMWMWMRASERARVSRGGVRKEEIRAERYITSVKWVCLRGTTTRVLGNNRMPESVAGRVQI